MKLTGPASQSLTTVDEQTIFRSIFGAYPDALLLVDKTGTIVLTNPAADTLFGYGPSELNGLNVDVLVPDSIRPRHAHYRETYAHNPKPRPMGTQMDLVAKRRDGNEVMVEIALSPLHDNQLPFVVVAIRGIGAYPRVKQALQRARYSEYVAQMGRLAVDTLDPQALLAQVPQVAAEALQVEAAALFLLEPSGLEFRVAAGIGLLPGEGIGAHLPNRPDVPAGFVLASGKPQWSSDYREERRVPVPQAYVDAGLQSSLGVPLFDRGRPVGVLTVRSRLAQRFGDDEVRFMQSLSNLLAATLQRVETEETLAHSQRLESVGQLTGGIAHDFNNLLTVIQGNLQVLEELPAIAVDAHAKQMVAAATRASLRGAELTKKLLAFSRRQVLSPSRIDVPTMVQSLADMLRRTLDQRVLIEVTASADDTSCLADAGQLEAALLNIAINARDAMPSGGRLKFSCCHVAALPAELNSEFTAEDSTNSGYAAIAISDTGSGMSEAVKERAFEPFFTTKEAGRGTGLGLSTVYGFAKQSKGAVMLESTVGVGTTVTLFIPSPAKRRDSPVDGNVARTELAQGLRVMLVEDEPEVRAVAIRFVQSMGCTATPFCDAEAALLALKGDDDFDLLVSDVALGPGMRGTELAREARALRPRIGVLLVSGFSAELLDINESAPVSWELLSKPYTRQQLQVAMAQALAVRDKV